MLFCYKNKTKQLSWHFILSVILTSLIGVFYRTQYILHNIRYILSQEKTSGNMYFKKNHEVCSSVIAQIALCLGTKKLIVGHAIRNFITIWHSKTPDFMFLCQGVLSINVCTVDLKKINLCVYTFIYNLVFLLIAIVKSCFIKNYFIYVQ